MQQFKNTADKAFQALTYLEAAYQYHSESRIILTLKTPYYFNISSFLSVVNMHLEE